MFEIGQSVKLTKSAVVSEKPKWDEFEGKILTISEVIPMTYDTNFKVKGSDLVFPEWALEPVKDVKTKKSK